LKVVPPLPLMRDERIIEREPDQRYLTRRYTQEAVRFITDCTQSGKPFFLYLPHTFPHPPLFASEKFAGKSRHGRYGDVVEELDWSTGEILRTLREQGVEKSTLVIFTSDNGPWLAKRQHGGSPGPLREGKGSTWEGGVRVPFIARWPSRIPEGIVTQAFATMMDLFPTFAALVGLEAPDDRVYDGEDLSAVLFERNPGREPLMFYWIRAQLRAVRKGPWKLHVATNEPANGTREATKHNPPLLFNLLEDPSENHNLAASRPDVVSELLSLMEEQR